MITLRDKYHGAVLRKIIRHRQIRIGDVGDKAGHFQIGDGAYLLVRYATNQHSPWRFIFRPEDVALLLADYDRAGLFGGSYVGLICGHDICSLGSDEWRSVLDLDAMDEQQTILVRRKPGCQFRVSGSGGALRGAIPVSRFPGLLFENGAA